MLIGCIKARNIGDLKTWDELQFGVSRNISVLTLATDILSSVITFLGQ
jgi:hypothetical protein